MTEMATSLGNIGLRLVFSCFIFMLCFIVTCENFLVYVWGENIKSPIPGLSELKIRGDIIDNPFWGLPRALDYAINLT